MKNEFEENREPILETKTVELTHADEKHYRAEGFMRGIERAIARACKTIASRLDRSGTHPGVIERIQKEMCCDIWEEAKHWVHQGDHERRHSHEQDSRLIADLLNKHPRDRRAEGWGRDEDLRSCPGGYTGPGVTPLWVRSLAKRGRTKIRNAPDTLSPSRGTCEHCGQPINWNNTCYVHDLHGFADCWVKFTTKMGDVKGSHAFVIDPTITIEPPAGLPETQAEPTTWFIDEP